MNNQLIKCLGQLFVKASTFCLVKQFVKTFIFVQKFTVLQPSLFNHKYNCRDRKFGGKRLVPLMEVKWLTHRKFVIHSLAGLGWRCVSTSLSRRRQVIWTNLINMLMTHMANKLIVFASWKFLSVEYFIRIYLIF